LLTWNTTRQPVCLKYWKVADPPNNGIRFSTLMNWTAGKTLFFRNERWGQKNLEFARFSSIPRQCPGYEFSIVVNNTVGAQDHVQQQQIEAEGWKILDPETTAGNWNSYQQFIQSSTCEFSVAKQTYVKANTGWFSCRSACYLASGRPVVIQDTGWSKFIPAGEGVLAFGELNEAVEAVRCVANNLPRHSLAAREIAVEYFNSDKVLNQLLEKVN
jgi:hypothetical protein